MRMLWESIFSKFNKNNKDSELERNFLIELEKEKLWNNFDLHDYRESNLFYAGVGFNCSEDKIKIEEITFDRHKMYGNMLVLAENDFTRHRLFFEAARDTAQNVFLIDEKEEIQLGGILDYFKRLYFQDTEKSVKDCTNIKFVSTLDYESIIRPKGEYSETAIVSLIETFKEFAATGVSYQKAILIVINRPSKMILKYLPELYRVAGGLAKIVLIDVDYRALFLKAGSLVMQEIEDNSGIRFEDSNINQKAQNFNIGIETFLKVLDTRYVLITKDFSMGPAQQ